MIWDKCYGGTGFQLPPSHEGEPSAIPPVCAFCVFQLPPSHEGEQDHGGGGDAGERISHEGERSCSDSRGRTPYFNSRPRMRANEDTVEADASGDVFQLPPSHEGERGAVRSPTLTLYFNSRPRMRANRPPHSLPGVPRKFQLPPSHESASASGTASS